MPDRSLDPSLDVLEDCCALARAGDLRALRDVALATMLRRTGARSGALYGLDASKRALTPLAATPRHAPAPSFDLAEAEREAAPIMAAISGQARPELGDRGVAAQLRAQVFGLDARGALHVVRAEPGGDQFPELVVLLLGAQVGGAIAQSALVRLADLAVSLSKRLTAADADRVESAALAASLSREAQTRARLTAQVEDELADRLVGDSPAMRALREQLLRLAPCDFSVLILGETGAGKELIARELHRNSARRNSPFVALNVAATPASLLEDELFGHVKGAFTGAAGARKGLVAAARGGTLFLDEIGDMPAELQAKLLRVLQERRFRPVGADEEIEADFRLLSATHRDLPARARSGEFRQDLYYRLASAKISAPALRERGEDVLQLAGLFLRRALEEGRRDAKRFSAAAEAALRAAEFPGNVRELESVVRRAAAIAIGRSVIEVGDLELDRAIPASPANGADLETLGALPLPDACDRFEKWVIAKALDRCAGAREPAAQALGIPVRTLADKLRKHGLRPDGARSSGHV